DKGRGWHPAEEGRALTAQPPETRPALGLGTTSLEWKAWEQTSQSSALGRPSTTWSCTSWPNMASSSTRPC
ncbi:PDE6G isoform 5, partial [Pan troglodytes]